MIFDEFDKLFKSFQDASLFALEQTKKTKIQHVVERFGLDEDGEQEWLVSMAPASKKESTLKSIIVEKEKSSHKLTEQRKKEFQEEVERANIYKPIQMDENGIVSTVPWKIDEDE